MALPPGPWWPAVFQTVAFLRAGQDFIASAAERYGDLFTVRTLVFGTQVFTSDPEITRQVFTGPPDIFHAGEANSSAKLLTGDTAVLVLDEGPHKRARRLLTPPFHGERMTAYAETMRAIVEGVISRWRVGERRPLLPDRFLGDKKLDPYAYLPFGGGPRRCLGAAFATQEMKVVLSTILHRFHLRLADPPPLRPAPRALFHAPEGGTRVEIVRERA